MQLAALPEKPDLERFRSWLWLQAEARLDRRLRSKLDACDIVQETLLDAYQAWSQFRGTSQRQLAAWLRQILARNLLHTARDSGRAKRNLARERPLEAEFEPFSRGPRAVLAADQPTPSQLAMRREECRRAAEAVQTLPNRQREAVLLYYWDHCSLAEVATHLGRSVPAVAGLLYRALARLRRRLAEKP
ncbi:MAG: sigma-70 family RNA polymerase sigma factor [Thermoguttaceae bacterium]